MSASPSSSRLRGALLLLIALAWMGWESARTVTKDYDLAPLYLAGRFAQQGKFEQLFRMEGTSFNTATSAEWLEEAKAARMTIVPTRFIYAPAVAQLLAPITRALSFDDFCRAVLWLNLAAMATLLWLSGMLWQPGLLRPVWFAATLLLLAWSEPLTYALWLGQTVPMVLFAMVAALFLAERRRPVLGGMLAAFPILVKLTPVILLAYWLWKREWRALLTCLATLGALALASIATAGWAANLAYVRTVQGMSGRIMVAYNNQSVLAWLARFRAQRVDLSRWELIPVTPFERLAATLILVLCCAIVAFVLYRARGGTQRDHVVLSMVFLFPLLFSPLAWSHYSLALLVPCVLLSRELWTSRKWLLAPLAVIIALNFQPLAVDSIRFTDETWVSSFLLANALCFVTVCLTALLPARTRQTADTPASMTEAA